MKPPRHRFRALFRTLSVGVTVVLTLACVIEVGVVVADAQPLLPEVVFGETVPNGNQSRVLDLNGDGTLDVLLLEGEVALPSIGTNRLLAYPGVGDGTFLDPLASDLLVVPELILAHQFSVTDYNQDGLPAVIVGPWFWEALGRLAR